MVAAFVHSSKEKIVYIYKKYLYMNNDLTGNYEDIR